MASQPTLLLRLVFLLSVASLVSHRATAQVGSYEPIPDLSDPYIQLIANFAVAQHNCRQTGEALVYVRVESGQKQVVAGINYRLIVVATDAGVKEYEAVVYKQGAVLTLASFRPAVKI
ncbi:hypothetical protein Taro_035702 [Colocasia esculenta]|uniref:Cystatin domain-containing protein n=1 Tax=Colocasia esculenta TaxID=4460 RepID=A0A843WJE7_COLES|nr:hypothetical protein [Colocasia esculenta]